MDIKELIERVKLTEEEIVSIYGERNWLLFDQELYRLQTVADAATNKALNDPDLYVKAEKELPKWERSRQWNSQCQATYEESQREMLKWHKESLIPLREALKEAQE